MANTISVETYVRVYDDDHGFFVEVAREGDTEMVKITYSDGEKDRSSDTVMTIPENMRKLVGQALIELAQIKEVPKNG